LTLLDQNYQDADLGTLPLTLNLESHY